MVKKTHGPRIDLKGRGVLATGSWLGLLGVGGENAKKGCFCAKEAGFRGMQRGKIAKNCSFEGSQCASVPNLR